LVAKTAPLPNIRKLFIPDPGYEIADADLAGADAQVVAWEANDTDLMDAFEAGLKVHIKNARDIFPEKVKGWSDEAIKATDYPGGVYHDNKRGVHLTNYGGTPKGCAPKLGWTIAEMERFQRNWFGLHPGILDWHERMRDSLTMKPDEFVGTYGIPGGGKTVFNRFGYRIIYFDRPDRLLPEALAWVPQSTVALVCNKGMVKVRRHCDWVHRLLQVHDSLVLQWPISRRADRHLVREQLLTSVPYPRPLTIQWSLATSTKSWGHAEAEDWE
jgi:hypothetical protein